MREVVVVGLITYNSSEEHLKQWRLSFETATILAKSRYPTIDFKLLWIDNGTKSVEFDDIQYGYNLTSRGNIGYTCAANLLMNEASRIEDFKYYLSSNPDGVFHPEFFINILTFANRYPNAIIECSQFPEEHPKYYDPLNYDTPWASGCSCLFPREILQTVGELDENFFMYCEDVDFSWRARLAGYKVKHCPKATYGHFVINRKSSLTTTKYFYESGRYLAYKWKNPEFQFWCEEILILEGIFLSPEELPHLPKINWPYSTTKMAEVCDFENKFYFGKGRW